MMPNLYELTQNAMLLQEMLESGEIDEQVFADTLDAMGLYEKVENVCKMIRNLEARSAAFKEEKDRLAKRQSACDNAVKRLKQNLLDSMQTMNKPKVEAGLFSVTRCTATSVNITDESKLDPMYLTPQPPKIDGKQILADLRAGAKLDGAELAQSEYVRIR